MRAAGRESLSEQAGELGLQDTESDRAGADAVQTAAVVQPVAGLPVVTAPPRIRDCRRWR